jgi:hypothetical protein
VWRSKNPFKRFIRAFNLSPWFWSKTVTLGETYLRIHYQNHSHLKISEEDFRQQFSQFLDLTDDGFIVNAKHKIKDKQTSYDLPEGWEDTIEIK